MIAVLANPAAVAYAGGMADVTATLRTALERCGESRYRVAQNTGIPESTLSRFAAGATLHGENLDRLCRYLGLELRPVRRKDGGR